MKHLLKIFSSVPLVALILNGCTMLILWNPIVDEMEFNKKISFNYHNIAVSISKMGFWNSHFNPEVHLKIKNYTQETISFNTDDFKLIIGTDTLTNKSLEHKTVYLESKKQIGLKLKYEYSLMERTTHEINGKVYEIPKPSFIFLKLAKIKKSNSIIQLPTIKYIYAYKNFYRTKFID